jgi:predicted Holliday junction resolvase-like endonuclease
MSLVMKILSLVITMLLVMIMTLPSELVKNPNAMIKGLMKQVGARDELLKQQEEFLVQERKISEELKKFLAPKKVKWRSLTNNLQKARRLLLVSRTQLVLFKVNMMPS